MPHGGLEAAKESHCFRNSQQAAGTACRQRHRFKVYKAIMICFEMKGGLRTWWNGKNIPDARGLPQHAGMLRSSLLSPFNYSRIHISQNHIPIYMPSFLFFYLSVYSPFSTYL